MSTAKYRWWGFARRMIRDYPSLKEQWNDLHEQSITAGDSGTGRGGGISRKTEQIALRTLPSVDDQKAFDAVRRAIELTCLMPEGKRHMQLIKLMYWIREPMAMESAACKIPIAESTAKRWHGSFVRLVGKCYGFEVDTSEPK